MRKPDLNRLSIVQATMDYKQFSNEGNRESDHWRGLARSIEKDDLTPLRPILIDQLPDGTLRIVDGGNRFKACRALNFPVYYQIGKDIPKNAETILDTNAYGWTPENFLNKYVEMGKADYIELQHILNELDYFTPSKLVKFVVKPKVVKSGGVDLHISEAAMFKSGEMVLRQDKITMAYSVNRVLEALSKIEKRLTAGHAALSAISRILDSGLCSVEFLVEKIERYGHDKLITVSRTDAFLEALEQCVNHRVSGKNRLDFNQLSDKYWLKERAA